MITTIRRYRKEEAETAIADLLKRGFTICYPLTEITSTGSQNGSYNYRKSRYTSRQGTMTSMWVAKLRIDNK